MQQEKFEEKQVEDNQGKNFYEEGSGFGTSFPEPPYTAVSKLKTNKQLQAQPTYIHVSKLVSSKDSNENIFDVVSKLNCFFTAIHSDVTKKIIYLTLQASRVYSGLAKKTLKIQDVQFNRQVQKLSKLHILEQARISNDEYDPFVRWVKQNNPNVPIKKLKLYKLTSKYRTIFSKIEMDLEQHLDKEIVDEIKHFRFSIKRTHRDILREKKMKRLQQKRLIEDAKKDIYTKIAGSCSLCGCVLAETMPSKNNRETYTNYRAFKSKIYCNNCYKTLLLGGKNERS